MARIRHIEMPRDLFGDVARGVSVPAIRWETYYEIVRLVIATYGKSLQRVTSKILAESYGTMSMVARRSNLVTVLVTEVYERDVAFILSFDDLKGTVLERNSVLYEIVRRARLGPILQVASGDLAGCITMENSINVVPFPERDTAQSFPKSKSGRSVNAEIEFLSARRAPKP